MDYSNKQSIPESASPDSADPIFSYSNGFCCCVAPLYSRRSSVWWNKSIGVLMRVREWSEIVAGPRWKTFIRRFNRNSRCSRMAQRFQYDPLSYALNFDDGVGGSDSFEADIGFGDFPSSSSRCAIMPPAKTMMDAQISPDHRVELTDHVH